MKSRITMFFAVVAICTASTAFGQYYPQQQIAPQQNWATTPAQQQAYAAQQQAIAAQNAAFGNTAPNAMAAPGCDAQGCCDGRGCDAVGCGGCDGRGGLGLGRGCGLGTGCCSPAGCDSGAGCDGCGGCGGFGLGNRCCGNGGGLYDPCNPTRYFSFFGGQTHFDDLTSNIALNSPAGGGLNIEALLGTDEGFGIGGAIGRSFGQRMRGEFEVAYRDADVEYAAITAPGLGGAGLQMGGDLSMLSFMQNLLFDLNPNGRFNAYVGVGAGVSFNELSIVEPNTQIAAQIEDSQFAYQGIIGVSTCVSDRADLFFEYRYFATDELSLNVATPIGSASADFDVTSHNYFAGIRIKRW